MLSSVCFFLFLIVAASVMDEEGVQSWGLGEGKCCSGPVASGNGLLSRFPGPSRLPLDCWRTVSTASWWDADGRQNPAETESPTVLFHGCDGKARPERVYARFSLQATPACPSGASAWKMNWVKINTWYAHIQFSFCSCHWGNFLTFAPWRKGFGHNQMGMDGVLFLKHRLWRLDWWAQVSFGALAHGCGEACPTVEFPWLSKLVH